MAGFRPADTSEGAWELTRAAHARLALFRQIYGEALFRKVFPGVDKRP